VASYSRINVYRTSRKATRRGKADLQTKIGDDAYNCYDGTKWSVTHGSVAPSVADLEHSLAQVKGSFRAHKRAREHHQAVELSDGSEWMVTPGFVDGKWIVTHGSEWLVVLNSRQPSASLIQKRLAEVKALFGDGYDEADAPVQRPTIWTHKSALGRGLFTGATVSQASKWDKKSRWNLKKNTGFAMDGQDVEIEDAFMSTFEPSALTSLEVTNHVKRRRLRSARVQALFQRAADGARVKKATKCLSRLRKERALEISASHDVE